MKSKTLSLMAVVGILLISTSCSNSDNIEKSAYTFDEFSQGCDYESGHYNSYYDCECEEDSEEDINRYDMSANITYYQSEGGIVYISRDEYGNISGHDLNGNYISGYSDQCGNTIINDMNGNYVYSYSDDYGNTATYDMNGNYAYSYTDSYGNTTGHDMNGNYYSAYTDDYGYTTVTTY
ncbi:MAG: hypothetical protein K2L45_04970 [Muribaculaceae bacterium]|nr:hypothetical protein [Muribaculaceae bacterium]